MANEEGTTPTTPPADEITPKEGSEGKTEETKTADGSTILGGTPPKDTETKTDVPPAAPGEELTGAPEQYQAFDLHGLESNDEEHAAFSAWARQQGYTQAQAQAVVDYGVAHAQRIFQAQAQAKAQQNDEWIKELKADPDLGGEKYAETCDRAKRALGKLTKTGYTEFVGLLEAEKLGSFPPLVRMLVAMDHLIGDDVTVLGSAAGKKGPVALEDVLFDNTDTG